MFRFYSHNILRDKGESWFTVNSKLLVADAERKKWQKLISKLRKMLTIMLLSVFDDDEAWENLFLVFDLIQKLVTFLIEDDSLPYNCYISVGSLLPIRKYWRWKVEGSGRREKRMFCITLGADKSNASCWLSIRLTHFGSLSVRVATPYFHHFHGK